MATIFTSPEQLTDASGPDLVATFKALGGTFKPGAAERFSSTAAGQRRVEMLMLVAKDADGHLGVPKGEAPVVRTQAELAKKAKRNGRAMPEAPALEFQEPRETPTGDADEAPAPTLVDGPTDDQPDAPAGVPVDEPIEPPVDAPPGTPVFAEGTLAKRLQGFNAKMKAIVPRPPKKGTLVEPVAKQSGRDIFAFRLTNAGTSKFQPGSRRGEMFLWIGAAHNQARTLAELEAHFKMPSRGEVQKLLKFNHIKLLNEADYAKLPQTLPMPKPQNKAEGAPQPKVKAKAKGKAKAK